MSPWGWSPHCLLPVKYWPGTSGALRLCRDHSPLRLNGLIPSLHRHLAFTIQFIQKKDWEKDLKQSHDAFVLILASAWYIKKLLLTTTEAPFIWDLFSIFFFFFYKMKQNWISSEIFISVYIVWVAGVTAKVNISMEITLFGMNLISQKYIYLQECQVILHCWKRRRKVTREAVQRINSYKQILGSEKLPLALIIFAFTFPGQIYFSAFLQQLDWLDIKSFAQNQWEQLWEGLAFIIFTRQIYMAEPSDARSFHKFTQFEDQSRLAYIHIFYNILFTFIVLNTPSNAWM